MAKDEPEMPYAELPLSSTSFDEGFRKVSYRDLSNAINGMAWWMNRSIGPGKNFETLTYLGPNDLRHIILLLGAVKAGFKVGLECYRYIWGYMLMPQSTKMLFTSPRYSAIAQVNLMQQLDCKTMLVPTVRPLVTNAILEAYDMRVYQIPELADLIDQDYPLYPYEKTFDGARGEPLVVLHTSGTTGFPKSIIWTHGWAASFAEERFLAPPSGYDSMDKLMLGVRLFSLMPPFHVSCSKVSHRTGISHH